MPRFTYRIEMATVAPDADEQAWSLFEGLRRILAHSDMQTNFFILEKDGKQYPDSRAALERLQAYERARQREEAKDRVRQARYNLAEAEKELASLEEPNAATVERPHQQAR